MKFFESNRKSVKYYFIQSPLAGLSWVWAVQAAGQTVDSPRDQPVALYFSCSSLLALCRG